MAVRVDPGHVHDAELSRLYEEYSNRIFGYCLYRLGNRTEAEDAVQTTFLYVFRSLQRGVEPENESAWLFTIAHNVCRSTRRSTRRRSRVETQQDPQVLQEISPGFERDNESLLGLEDALSSIPESQRQAIILREWHGLPYREIATKLGLTQTAVEMLVFRARRSLASALDNGGKRPERRRIASALNIASLVAAFRNLMGGASAASGVGVTAAAGIAVVAVGVGGSAPTVTVPVRNTPPPKISVAPVATTGPAGAQTPLAIQRMRTARPQGSGPAVQQSATLDPPTAPTHDESTPAGPDVPAPGATATAPTTSSHSPASPTAAPTTTKPATPVEAVASQLPQLPAIGSSAPAPQPVALPLPSVSVSVPTITVPSVADAAHDVGSALPKLP